MTDYEHILIGAVRYALGRQTYIVRITADYVASQLPKLSDNCIEVMMRDIKSPFGACNDERDWMCLLEQLEEEMKKRYGQADSRNT